MRHCQGDRLLVASALTSDAHDVRLHAGQPLRDPPVSATVQVLRIETDLFHLWKFANSQPRCNSSDWVCGVSSNLELGQVYVGRKLQEGSCNVCQ